MSIPVSGQAMIGSVQTHATGTNYVTLSAFECDAVEIVNAASGAVDIEYRRLATGNTMIVPLGTSRMIIGIKNANEIGIRRVDQSNTQVTVAYETFVNAG